MTPGAHELLHQLLARCTFQVHPGAHPCAFSGGADSTALVALARHAGRGAAMHVEVCLHFASLFSEQHREQEARAAPLAQGREKSCARAGAMQSHAPPVLLEQMVAQGKLGKKSGEGFYTW